MPGWSAVGSCQVPPAPDHVTVTPVEAPDASTSAALPDEPWALFQWAAATTPASAARRRGIGRLLLAHAERACREAGYDRVVLSTAELQQAALGLYRASGYRLVREEIAAAASNKTVGSGLKRFHFEKHLD